MVDVEGIPEGDDYFCVFMDSYGEFPSFRFSLVREEGEEGGRLFRSRSES